MSLEFLQKILPTQGTYCSFAMRNGRPLKTLFVDTLDNLLETNLRFSTQGLDAFHGMASFDTEGSREASHALFMRSFFMDLDCGKEWVEEKTIRDEVIPAHWKQKAFASKRDAATQMLAFLSDTGLGELGSPWMVSSGGGIHAYWPLDRDVTIAEWLPVANALKVAAQKQGFAIDYKVTSDVSRVLRTPGTTNNKTGTPRPVELRQQGDIFTLEDIAACVSKITPLAPPRATSTGTGLMISGTRPTAAVMSPAAKALAGNSATYFKNILVRTQNGDGCGQVAHYIQHAKDDGMEPLWRGMLSLTKYCDDGAKASARISNMHPYDEGRMQQKLAAIKGPYSCAALEDENPGGCDGCIHKGRITNPLILGRELLTTTDPALTSYTPQSEDTVPVRQIPQMPTPPKGYLYGTNSALFYVKQGASPDERQEILLTNYYLYMTRMFRDGTEFMAEFVAVKGAETTTFGIPTALMGDPKGLVKELAKNNVFAVGGTSCDNYLAAYVRACMTEASGEGRYVAVPPRFGWQDNGDFAVGDTVYSRQGRHKDYTFKSKTLHNIMEATRPSGTLDNWKKVLEMLRKKAVDDPVIWGHCAVSLTGFASTLMKFAPKGAPALTIHICGKESGAGKTLSSLIANSVFGEPAGLRVSNKTSETTMLQRAGMLGSISLHVDEVTDRNRKSGGEWLPNFLYDYSHGAHKVKGSATGNAEIQQDCKWNSISTISSNDPALEAMMGARIHTSYGEARRFLEWKLPNNWVINWTPEEREILSLMDSNYGVAGPVWIKWLQENHDVAQDVYARVSARWREVSGADDNERFWTGGVAAELTAAILTGPGIHKETGRPYANLTAMPYSKLEEFWLKVIRYMRSVIGANKANSQDILNAYLREYIGNFVRVDQTSVSAFAHLINTGNAARNAVRGRIEFDVTPGHVTYYIELKLLKAHCAAAGQSFIDFEDDLRRSELITVTTKNLLSGTKSPPLTVKCLRVTRAIADIDADTI